VSEQKQVLVMVVSTFNDWQIGAVVENAAIGDIVSGRPSFLVDLRQPLYPKKIDIRKSLSLTSASALLRFALEAGAVDACLCMLGVQDFLWSLLTPQK
jgi:hypothetical protein